MAAKQKTSNPSAPDHHTGRRGVSRVIFMSRWLQLPLYVGLIAAQGIYVWQFWLELVHLLSAAFGDSHAIQSVTCSVQAAGVDCAKLAPTGSLTEATVMLVVLGLVGEFLRFWYDYDARMKVLEAQRAASVRAPSSQGDRP